MKPAKCPAREKNEAKKAKKEGRREREKTFCFLHMPELRKLIFCIWIKRPQTVRPVKGFVVRFSTL